MVVVDYEVGVVVIVGAVALVGAVVAVVVDERVAIVIDAPLGRHSR